MRTDNAPGTEFDGTVEDGERADGYVIGEPRLG